MRFANCGADWQIARATAAPRCVRGDQVFVTGSFSGCHVVISELMAAERRLIASVCRVSRT